jgi:DNA-directed RNA polymerase specialized sigma24 family protein
MNPAKPRAARRDRTLSAEGFDLLLGSLGRDRDEAGARYEVIRRKLTSLFRWRGCADPEALADETIDRVAARLAEGAAVFAQDPYSFFHGVAVRVLQEYWRRPARREDSLEEHADGGDWPSAPPPPAEEDAGRVACLDRCLARLPDADRDLVAAYHAADDGDRIAARRALAGRLGLTMGALRIKVFRLRAALLDCVNTCCGRTPGETDPPSRA